MKDFHPLTAEWFETRFGEPTEPQCGAWPAIRAGRDVLISAPTGSGKTLAAFLICLDRLVTEATAHGALDDQIDVVYVSPLKALSTDINTNLEVPLREISALADARGVALPPIRSAVRTGDTPASKRAQMVRRPPHVLVTTPESLFILLTSERGRQALAQTRTMIVDEIHALVGDKRGSHLALTLARLEHLVRASGRPRPQRIGLSATVNPIDRVARFLSGGTSQATAQRNKHHESSDQLYLVGRDDRDKPADTESCDTVVIDSGHRRAMDLAIEVPQEELGVVATNEMWEEIYDRLADHVRAHRTTLIFVNSRRLSERVAHHLAERLSSDVVLAHHGSLARQIRQAAERDLKAGKLRAVVATASLELGIDIGAVDLVCQIGSPRAIGVALQRIGRSGHTVDQSRRPKGRFFPTTRDELLECAALVRAIRAGTLDALRMPAWPRDILAQQLVAAAACEDWSEEALYRLVCGADPYRDLPRSEFDAVIGLLAEGVTTDRGRYGAYLHRDRVNSVVRARRGARLAAITSGGAIPDNANYLVTAEPEGHTVGTVDEDFAIESMAGDIFLLGTSSWRIRRVEAGRLRVDDAHGAAPTVPFWRGEAPGRTRELSHELSTLRTTLSDLVDPDESMAGGDGETPDEGDVVSPAVDFLQRECGVDAAGAAQAVAYVTAGRAALGVTPSMTTVVAERFFDEAGGMQLVVHAPFGARINRAWGLALRKRFCRSFNFELQAAATDNGIVISLAEQHSFPLDTIFQFLQADSVEDVLTQAMLPAPMFAARWRWNVSRALAVLRFAGGRKVAPPIQRMRSDDLLASVFPDQAACQENIVGEIRIPEHPLIKETIRDCLDDAMDLEGLRTVLRGIHTGTIACHAVDTPEPSPLGHEILNANPYAFLDDAPLEERRARAVQLRRTLPDDARGVGALDQLAISEVSRQVAPVVRGADELHDALLTLCVIPASTEWQSWYDELARQHRVMTLNVRNQAVGDGFRPLWIPAERMHMVRLAYQDAWTDTAREDALTIPEIEQPLPDSEEAAVTEVIRGWLATSGPQTPVELIERLALDGSMIQTALLRLEGEGQVLRGRFSAASRVVGAEIEWCNRHVLAKIHRLTLGRLRREIEPVTAADFVRFLSRWQHVAAGTQLHGASGLRQIVTLLQGYEISAAAWEHDVLRRRVANYDPEMLDQLCLTGEVAWGRLSPHPAFGSDADADSEDDSTGAAASAQTGDIVRERSERAASRRRRVRPTRAAPVALFLREDASWLVSDDVIPDAPPSLSHLLSHPGGEVLEQLQRRGASFLRELVASTRRLPSEVEDGLWELVAAGLVTADGFDNLRALVDPKRRRGEGRQRAARPRDATGRWALLRTVSASVVPSTANDDAVGADGSHRTRVEQFSRQLLRRWGVVFHGLLARETMAPPWRDVLATFRRWEAKGEIRGGRFVDGFVGEQFALPEALDSLRAVRRQNSVRNASPDVSVSAADPLNLTGIITPGERVSALSRAVVDVLGPSS